MAFVFGEIVAIYDKTALLLLTVLFILPEIIKRIYNSKEKEVCEKGIISMDILLIVMLSMCFAVTGYLLTCKEVEKKDALYLMEEQQVTVSGKISKITETQYGFNYIVKADRLGEIDNISLFVESEEQYDVKLGNRVKIIGQLEKFEDARNQGNFSLKKYYMTLGIYGKIECSKLQVIENRIDVIKENLRLLKQEIGTKIDNICSDENKGIFKICNSENGGILKAILLGDKQEIDTDIKNLYQLNGISHILAISGLHISFIGMLIYSVIRKKMKFIPAAFVSMSIVILFSIMTGFGFATIRATIMFGMKIIGEVLGRSYDVETSISLACIFIVSSNPFAILNSGFQMSFAAIIGANIVWKRVRDFCGQKGKIFQAVGFSLTISILMNPIIAWNYYQIPIYSVFLNLIVVPFMGVVIAGGLAALIAAYIYLPVGRIFIMPSCIILQLYTLLCDAVSKIPGYNLICGKPSIWVVLLYYGVIVFVFIAMEVWIRKEERKKKERKISRHGEVIESEKEKRRRLRKVFIKKCVCLGVIFVGITFSLFAKRIKGLEISFMDVGQGDGILMQTKEVTITVDGGSSDVTEVGKYRIIPFLKSKGIRKIDYAIVSHWDSDHISGLKELLQQQGNDQINIENLILSKTDLLDGEYIELTHLAEKAKTKVFTIKQGDIMKFGKLKIVCIHPGKDFSATDRNEYSNILKVDYGDFKMLLTGDVGTETEPYFIDSLEDKYTVLKVPHHGSKYSASEEFLRKITPKYAIISAGVSNSYGHPHQELIERLQKQGIDIYCTKERGQVILKTNGSSMNLWSYFPK